MAQKTISNTEYIQANTNSTLFLVQNISSVPVGGVFSSTQPSPDTPVDIILPPYSLINQHDYEGILWFKSLSSDSATISVVEE